MDRFEITLDEDCMKQLIQDFLCLNNNSKWIYTSQDSMIKLTFHGNIYKIQKDIYEWLSVPPRKRNFELLGGS